MEQNRGVALILALLVLSFLTVLGSALLTTSTIDIWISDNYKSATRTLYLAEAGIEHAREILRTSGRTATESLNSAAGPDRQLLTADDQPLIPLRELTPGQHSGSYEVWLRNDNADGMASLIDNNEILTLVSQGRIGNTLRTIEVTVLKGGFPETNTDPRLNSVAGLENLAGSITRNATDIFAGSTMNACGGPADYRAVVVDGNLNLGPGTGYGLLLVRGELHIVGDITWNGLILVIGQGVLQWSPGMSGTIRGGLFIAKTRDMKGAPLSAPQNVSYNVTSTSEIKTANRRFPYNPIAIWER